MKKTVVSGEDDVDNIVDEGYFDERPQVGAEHIVDSVRSDQSPSSPFAVYSSKCYEL